MLPPLTYTVVRPFQTVRHFACWILSQHVVCWGRCLLQAAQIQLDRAAEDFRQLHQERQDLIRQWDEARDAMKSRDEAIQVISQKLCSACHPARHLGKWWMSVQLAHTQLLSTINDCGS